MNNLKTMVLIVTLTLMLVFIGGLLGGKSGMTFALMVAFAMNFITYWFSDKIVLKLYGAREVNESEPPEHYGIVARLSQPHRCIRQTRREHFQSLGMRVLLELDGLSTISPRVKSSKGNGPGCLSFKRYRSK